MHIKRKNQIYINDNKSTNTLICVIIFSIAIILKFGYYRFSYFPILDDYIQYGSYHLYDKSYVLFDIGTIYTRPLSALCDLYVWGVFRNNLRYAFIIITATHFVSAFLFKRAFSKLDIHLGNLFLIFYLLSPVLSEAVYWVSASTRIVPGLLFCALSLNLLYEYLKQKKFYLWLLTFLTHFISYGFYEQTTVLSFVVFIYFVVTYSKKNIFALSIPIICLSFYAIYYLAFNGYGCLGSRMDMSGSFSQILSTAKRLIRIATVQGFELTSNGFARGLSLLFENPLYMSLVIMTSLSFLFFKNTHFKSDAKKFILGILILVLPLVPYLLLSKSYPEFRSMYTVIMGFGIILDEVLEKYKFKNIICVILAFVFITANVSETHDYKAVYDKDQQILYEICLSKNLTEYTDTYITGAKEYYTDVNSRLGSHIANITSSSWALTGAARNYTKNPQIKKLIPIYNSSEHFPKSIDISHIK